jgi:hypothetical protein
VLTSGIDSQKNHSLGIFRDSDDSSPFFRNTAKYDLAEAYVSYLVPVGEGLTLKAGKWATPIGYEVYENPKNLNFSRSFLYTLGTPYFHTGLLATYPVTKWFGVTAGFTNGWDNADNNNGHLRPIGSFAFAPTDKLSATVSWLVGPEQNRSQMLDGVNNRFVVDTTIVYTGIERWTFAVNFDLAGEENDPQLVGTRRDADSRWGGIAGYVAYDWTKALRTAVRWWGGWSIATTRPTATRSASATSAAAASRRRRTPRTRLPSRCTTRSSEARQRAATSYASSTGTGVVAGGSRGKATGRGRLDSITRTVICCPAQSHQSCRSNAGLLARSQAPIARNTPRASRQRRATRTAPGDCTT